ncbi:MAG TPA: hypothetical protein VG713_01435, partial [Pirellulales bacterium]|nr:hypothetical protein [Pirellulales bacterium]
MIPAGTNVARIKSVSPRLAKIRRKRMSLNTLCNGCALGAGLMYFFDPHHGRRRRAVVEDQVQGFLGDFTRGLDRATHEIQSSAKHLVNEVTGIVDDSRGGDNRADKYQVDRPESEALTPGMKLIVGAAGLSFAMYVTRRPGLVLGMLGLATLGSKIAHVADT